MIPTPSKTSLSRDPGASARLLDAFAVAKRCELLDDPKKRALVWFLHARSIAPGGLEKLADDLLQTFPDRIGTATMHRVGTGTGAKYDFDTQESIAQELKETTLETKDAIQAMLVAKDFPEDFIPSPRPGPIAASDFVQKCIEIARSGSIELPSIANHLAELAVNGSARINFHDDSQFSCSPSGVPYFRGLIGAVLDYKASIERQARDKFQSTAVSSAVWKALDDALISGQIALIHGLEGRGKTHAVKTWCCLHQSEARFISLSGINNKTVFFKRLAEAIGLSIPRSMVLSEIQHLIEETLQSSRLMLVIDEAHYLFAQAMRSRTRPELVDWIVTALNNGGAPVGLVTTPQFIDCLAKSANDFGWNYKQFQRRMRFTELPKTNSIEDIRAVCGKVLPGATAAGIKLVMSYANLPHL